MTTSVLSLPGISRVIDKPRALAASTLALFLVTLAWETTGAEPLEGAIALNTEEISQAFADVKDQAEVQDVSGTRAVNHWFANGTFTNSWSNATGSGEVVGRWWAEDNKRCVLITDGLPERGGVAECSPIYRHGDTYLSIESDGSIHGVHRLSPIE